MTTGLAARPTARWTARLRSRPSPPTPGCGAASGRSVSSLSGPCAAPQATAADARVAYVDNDPTVLVHARALLTSTPEGATAYLDADLRDPDQILDSAAKLLDFSRPAALLLIGILQLIPDADHPHAIVRRLVGALAP